MRNIDDIVHAICFLRTCTPVELRACFESNENVMRQARALARDIEKIYNDVRRKKPL